ncbi:MAG: proton-conducting transporter membrane subunit [Thermoanaerobaculia bacterium]
MTLALIVLAPAVLGLLAVSIENVRTRLAILVGTAILHLLATAFLWTGIPGMELGLLTVDAMGLLFLSITSVIFLAASLYTIPYLLKGTHDPQAAPRRFVPCLLWFLTAMTLVTVTQNLALMWAAVEGTTLASAPLVYFYRRRGALEATWKYLLVCSVGIALALLGTFFLGIATSSASSMASDLTLPALMQAAPSMSRPWLTAAFVLALVGYGTKMGLVPLHTWLPDTHSQAPSPVSALLSGALLNCAFLAILRFFQVCLASGDFAFARTLLLVLGFLSIGIACAFLVRQRDYKRLFAYSSIENMGIMAVGVGLGGSGTYGALLHAVNHSFCKAGLFFLAGNVLRAFGTTSAREVRGVLQRLPVTGILMMALFLAIGGTPPFGPFWSEFLIFQSAMHGGQAWLGALFVALLAVAFLGMAGVLLPMLQGRGAETGPREATLSIVTPLAMACGALVLGIYVPPFLADALRRAANALGG